MFSSLSICSKPDPIKRGSRLEPRLGAESDVLVQNQTRSKGDQDCSVVMVLAASAGSKPDPIKRGSRRKALDHCLRLAGSKPDPIKRGSRQLLLWGHRWPSGSSKPDPIKRGSRLEHLLRGADRLDVQNQTRSKGDQDRRSAGAATDDRVQNQTRSKGDQDSGDAPRRSAGRAVQNQTRSKGDQDLGVDGEGARGMFKTRPDQKGIKTFRCIVVLPLRFCSKPDPIKRGSRHVNGSCCLWWVDRSKPDPIKRGSRPRAEASARGLRRSKPDPIKRGSRRRRPGRPRRRPCVQNQTRSKGDQDHPCWAEGRWWWFKTRPDQKGIKTGAVLLGEGDQRGSKPDPIKRGSRRQVA